MAERHSSWHLILHAGEPVSCPAEHAAWGTGFLSPLVWVKVSWQQVPVALLEATRAFTTYGLSICVVSTAI